VADDRVGHVEWSDVGYLWLIYVYVVLVRAVVILVSYPVLRRTGLGTTWRDCVFMVWGGLRGSVGIALAVTLDLSIQETGTTDADLRKTGERLERWLDACLAVHWLAGWLAGWRAHIGLNFHICSNSHSFKPSHRFELT
jgi:hypothetical protein